MDIGIGVRLRDELTQRAETVSWGECGGVASEECSSGLMGGAVSFASRACSCWYLQRGGFEEESRGGGTRSIGQNRRKIRILREF